VDGSIRSAGRPSVMQMMPVATADDAWHCRIGRCTDAMQPPPSACLLFGDVRLQRRNNMQHEGACAWAREDNSRGPAGQGSQVVLCRSCCVFTWDFP
jgi:hypothetical protein